MSVRSRQTKVFAALLVSITVGAIILKALGNNPPSAGAFCLSRYYRLDPVEKCILSRAAQYPGRWSCIEIYYSGTGATCNSNKRMLDTQRESRIQDRESRCHFVVCNGSIGHDGQILPTEEWQRQCPLHQLRQSGQSQTADSQRSISGGHLVWSKTPGSEQTIYICVIADYKVTRPVRNLSDDSQDSTMGNMIQKGKISNGARPTDFQIKRTEALVERLSRKFNIRPESIHYPDNWQ
ncbi:MAG: hypothetical protein ACYS9C_18665 [Planctomycetota bacterium]|jgi:hypothetical protein